MEKINFEDLTLIIPVFIDNKERIQNLWLTLYYMNKNFDVNIIVAEQNNNLSEEMCNTYPKVKFMNVQIENDLFYKTKLLNTMLNEVKTNLVASYDCDVLFTINQYVKTVEALRNNEIDMVWPFNRPTAEIIRKYFNDIIKINNPDELPPEAYAIFVPHLVAPGGAVFTKTQIYKEGGGENEFFVSYGPEDLEKHHRFYTLGYSLGRIDGFLYHLHHSRGINSLNTHKHHAKNEFEFARIKKFTKEELWEEVKGWEWYERLNV